MFQVSQTSPTQLFVSNMEILKRGGIFGQLPKNTVLENLVKVDLSADRLSDKFDILKFYWAFGLVTHQF